MINNKKLLNQTAVITGGSKGIGKAIAISLAKSGANVVIQYNTSEQKALTTASEIMSLGCKVNLIKADFTKQKDIEYFKNKVFNSFDNINILINCAAGYYSEPFLKVVPEKFSLMHKLNVEVPLQLMQIFANNLIQKKLPGSIINISSIAGIKPFINSCPNSCTKASLNMLTKSAALELAKYNIRVNAIALGTIDSEQTLSNTRQYPKIWKKNSEKIPLKRFGIPEDCTEIITLLASNDSAWITGSIINCDGGMLLI